MDVGNVGSQISGQVSQYLNGLDFPAQKQDVVQQAENNQANGAVVSALQKIPDGVYDSANQVAEKVGATGQ